MVVRRKARYYETWAVTLKKSPHPIDGCAASQPEVTGERGGVGSGAGNETPRLGSSTSTRAGVGGCNSRRETTAALRRISRSLPCSQGRRKVTFTTRTRTLISNNMSEILRIVYLLIKRLHDSYISGQTVSALDYSIMMLASCSTQLRTEYPSKHPLSRARLHSPARCPHHPSRHSPDSWTPTTAATRSGSAASCSRPSLYT